VPTAADELRQLTREAREATKDARAATRELRAAHAELGTAVDRLMADRVNADMEVLNKHIKDGESQVITSFQKGQLIIEQQHAELLGVTTPEALIDLMTRTFMEKIHEREILEAIAEHVAEHIQTPVIAKGRCRL
jgi:hypothetical protein